VIHTGQHYDRELSQVFFEELGLEEPRYRLDLRTADPEVMQPAIAERMSAERPDWVLVYGDTNSTLAGALAAEGLGLPLAHVEAGLRSGDLSMPEERNRIETDKRAALLFAPDGPYAALTIHREANTKPDRLRELIFALAETDWRFVFPVHPRTQKVLDEHGIDAAPLNPIDPVGYLEMLALVAGAARVVTDSGGLQKEAYWLRIPCITLRPTTEWIDTVLVKANRLVEPEEIDAALEEASFPQDAPELYGDGHAAERIAEALYTLPPT
jgi:UDP-GlcNAc3NAcA epimerase